MVFARTPMNCLQHVQKTWPRNGVLRVEIVRNASENYSIWNSYEKEYSDFNINVLEGLFSEKKDIGAEESGDEENDELYNQTDLLNYTSDSDILGEKGWNEIKPINISHVSFQQLFPLYQRTIL